MTDLKVNLFVTTNDALIFRLDTVLRLTSTYSLSKMLSNGWSFYRIYNEFVYKIAFDGIQLCLRCRKDRGNLYLSHVDVYAFNELTGVAYMEDIIYNFDLTIYDTNRKDSLRVFIDKSTPVFKYRRFILV